MTMKAETLRKSILQYAIQGKLVPQIEAEEPARILLQKISSEKQELIKQCKIKKEKPLPAISEDEIPFEIPDSWEWVRLADIVQINPRNEVDDNTKVSFIPMTLIDGNYSNTFSCDERKWVDVKKSFTHFRDNDVIFAKIMPCFQNRKSAVMHNLKNGFGAGTTELHVLRQNALFVLPLYLLWFIKSPYFILAGESVMTGTAGQQRVGTDYVKSALLPLPPLEEQHRIVARIEELMVLVDKYEEKQIELEKLETEFPEKLKKSILQYAIQGKLVPQLDSDEPASVLLRQIKAEKEELIKQGKIKRPKPLPPITEDEKPFEIPDSWEWIRLDDICSKIGSGSTPTGGKKVYPDSGIMFLREQNIYNDGLSLSNVAYITDEMNRKKAGSVVKSLDLLLNITGGSIGRCALVPPEFKTANINQHILILRSINPQTVYYLHQCICSPYIQNLIMDKQVGAKEGLSATKAKNFLVPMPPLSEQKRIVYRIEELFSLVDMITAGKKLKKKTAEVTVSANPIVDFPITTDKPKFDAHSLGLVARKEDGVSEADLASVLNQVQVFYDKKH